MRRIIKITLLLIGLTGASMQSIASAQQVIPPGQLVLGGMPMLCGPAATAIQPIPDVAIARPEGIYLNPALFSLPGTLQQFIYAHECAHMQGILNEAAADCWAIRTGRNQGWFPPPAFGLLIQFFQNNPGDWTHAPGPVRLQNLANCGNS